MSANGYLVKDKHVRSHQKKFFIKLMNKRKMGTISNDERLLLNLHEKTCSDKIAR